MNDNDKIPNRPTHNTPRQRKVLKIKDFDNIEQVDMDNINPNRVVYDILTKTFVPYDEYMANYRDKMYGLKSKDDYRNSQPKDDIDYFD